MSVHIERGSHFQEILLYGDKVTHRIRAVQCFNFNITIAFNGVISFELYYGNRCKYQMCAKHAVLLFSRFCLRSRIKYVYSRNIYAFMCLCTNFIKMILFKIKIN